MKEQGAEDIIPLDDVAKDKFSIDCKHCKTYYGPEHHCTNPKREHIKDLVTGKNTYKNEICGPVRTYECGGKWFEGHPSDNNVNKKKKGFWSRFFSGPHYVGHSCGDF